MNHIGSPKWGGRPDREWEKKEKKDKKEKKEGDKKEKKEEKERSNEVWVEEVGENGEKKKKKRSLTSKKPVQGQTTIQGRMRSSSTSTVLEISALSPLAENSLAQLAKENANHARSSANLIGGGGGGISPSHSVGGVSARKVSLVEELQSKNTIRVTMCSHQFASQSAKGGGPDQSSFTPLVVLPPAEAAYWQIEAGSSDAETKLLLVDNDRYTSYFQMYFYQKESEIYVGYRPLDRFFVLCVGKARGKKGGEGGSEFPRHALLICSKLDDPTVTPTLWAMLPPSKKPTLKQVKESELGRLVGECKLTKVEEEDFHEEFVKAEANLIYTSYKFIVVEIGRDGKVVVGEEAEEDEGGCPFYFSSFPSSSDFQDFLAVISSHAERETPKRDKEEDFQENGEKDKDSWCIKTSFQQTPVSFTILNQVTPPTPQNRIKRLEQAVVVVVFIPEEVAEGESFEGFDPSQSIFSEMNHAFVVVQKRKERGYCVNCVSRHGAHSATPGIPSPPFFEENTQFIEFLITKCINSQRSVAYSPLLAKKMAMKRKLILSDIVEKYSRKKNPKPQMKRSMSIKKHTPFKKSDPDAIIQPSSPTSPSLSPRFNLSPPTSPPTRKKYQRKFSEPTNELSGVIRRKPKAEAELELLNRQILELEEHVDLLLGELGRPPLSQKEKTERKKRAREKVLGKEG